MEHRTYKEYLQLSLYGELGPDEERALEGHLAGCEECRKEAEEMRRLHATLGAGKPPEVDDALLQEARQELRAALRIERNRKTVWGRIREWGSFFATPKIAFALGGVAIMALGIGVGYLISNRQQEKFIDGTGKTVAAADNPWTNFDPHTWQNMDQAPGSGNSTGNGGSESNDVTLNQGDVRIDNVKILRNDAAAGEVEFTFEAVTPMHIRGNVNDPRVQKVLTHALLNAENPGVRLRSVTAIAAQNDNPALPADKEVKAALIKALRTDDNPAVRKEALRALQKFPLDSDIKSAFLQALLHDNNAGIRVAIINTLDSMKTNGLRLDNDVLEVLKDKMHNDDNNYIRLRAKAAVHQEIHQ